MSYAGAMNEHVALKLPDSDYERDFYAWSLRQAELLRAGRFDEIDIENVSEEIESLARTDKRTVLSQFVRIIHHLLKLRCAERIEPRAGWMASVNEARDAIADVVEDSPSLRREGPELFTKAWPRGCKAAVADLNAYSDGAAALTA